MGAHILRGPFRNGCNERRRVASYVGLLPKSFDSVLLRLCVLPEPFDIHVVLRRPEISSPPKPFALFVQASLCCLQQLIPGTRKVVKKSLFCSAPITNYAPVFLDMAN